MLLGGEISGDARGSRWDVDSELFSLGVSQGALIISTSVQKTVFIRTYSKYWLDLAFVTFRHRRELFRDCHTKALCYGMIRN